MVAVIVFIVVAIVGYGVYSAIKDSKMPKASPGSPPGGANQVQLPKDQN